jgi:hypothetical protein
MQASICILVSDLENVTGMSGKNLTINHKAFIKCFYARDKSFQVPLRYPKNNFSNSNYDSIFHSSHAHYITWCNAKQK